MQGAGLPPGGDEGSPARGTFEAATTEAAARGAAPSERETLWLIGVLAAAFALRLYLLEGRPLWIDEAYSLVVAARPLREIPALLRATDVHPLGYYAFLAVWVRCFGTGLAAVRFPSLLFSLTAVWLTWRVGRQLLSPAIGLVAAALVALNPFQIIAANEIRMYPLLECLALVSTWIVWRAAAEGAAGRRWWVAYGFSVVAMAYTSYYAFVLAPAQSAWAWLSPPSRRRAAVNLLLAAGVAILCYLPWIPYLPAVRDTVMARRAPFVPGYLLGLAADQTFGGYLFGAGNYQELGVGLALPYVLLLLFPFVALLAAGIVLLPHVNKASARLVVVSWAGPLLLIVVAGAVRGQIVAYPRHLVFLQPFAAFLIAGAVVHAWAHMPAARTARPLAACLLLVAFGYPAIAEFNPAAQHYRYDLAAEFVEIRYEPGDAIVYFPAGTDLAFRYYFRAPGTQVSVLWSGTRWSREGFEREIARAADAVAASRSSRVWLVYSLPWPKGSLNDLVQALVAKSYRPGPSWDFHDLWVTLLTRPAASTR